MPIGLQVLYLIAFSLAIGVFVVMRRGRAMAGYAALLGINLLLVLMLIGTGRFSGPAFWIAVGCFSLLVVAPALLRALQHRALAADRFAWALRLAWFRELLQPGAGVSREREMLSAVALARRGETQAAIDHLESWASRGGRGRLLEAQEQIVAILMMERRFEDAIAYGEALGPEAMNRPVLCAGLVRAYAESGDLARSAAALRRLEAGPAGTDPWASDLINQARLFFLAHVGEAEAVSSLIATESGFLPALSEKSRAYWRGVALMRAGRVDSARAELLRAQAMAGADEERFRGAIRERIAAGPGEAAPEDAVHLAREVGLRASVHRTVPRGGQLLRVAPVTVGLGILLVLVWALVALGGSSTDSWTLIRAGGHFRPAVRAGDLWRIVSATFLHAGPLHLALNVYALLVFGPFVERLYGSTRFFVLYMASGVAGFVASFTFGRAPLSVGASGCVFGMLGAAIAILVVRRGHWPEGWRRGTLMNFAFLAAINVAIGFSMPMIDNAAHLGGLTTGVALGLLLVPDGILGSGALARLVVGASGALAMAAVATGAGGVLRTNPATLLTRLPTKVSRMGAVMLVHPDPWFVERRGEEEALIDLSGAVGFLAGKADPAEVQREISRQLPDDDDAPSELACRRLAAGPTFCLRFPKSGRAAYLPVLARLAATSRAAR